MEIVVLDTDVWSYLYKGDTRADLFRDFLLNKQVAISFQTVAELYFWAKNRNWAEPRLQDLAKALSYFVILHSDIETSLIWSDIRSKRAKIGKPLSPQDAWIAACTIRHKATLLTHNASDFSDIPELILL